MKRKILALTMGIVLAMTTTAFAANIERLGGSDRYKTAALINNEMNSETLILVSGSDFADALSSAGLIKYYNAEIHLLNRGNLDSNTITSLNKNEFKRAIIIGGTAVISENIEDYLKNKLGKENVERLGGLNRYETSAIVASKIVNNSDYSGGRVFIATGKDFADALSVASISAFYGYPIILTQGEELTELAINVLNNRSINMCYKIGGEAVVSNKIDSLIPKDSYYIKRLGGLDRYETNKRVIGEFSFNTFDYNNIYVANGLDFPDALTGSALAAKKRAPIVLVNNKDIKKSTKDIVDCFASENLIALGGTGAVSNKTMEELSNSKIYKEPVFEYKNKVVLSKDRKGEFPTAEDIGLIAIGKKGNDCSWTFWVGKGGADENGGSMSFTVVIDGEIKQGSVRFTWDN